MCLTLLHMFWTPMQCVPTWTWLLRDKVQHVFFSLFSSICLENKRKQYILEFVAKESSPFAHQALKIFIIISNSHSMDQMTRMNVLHVCMAWMASVCIFMQTIHWVTCHGDRATNETSTERQGDNYCIVFNSVYKIIIIFLTLTLSIKWLRESVSAHDLNGKSVCFHATSFRWYTLSIECLREIQWNINQKRQGGN